MTDAMEAAGQHVQQGAARELAGLERHDLVAGGSLRAAVLLAEGLAALAEFDQALGGDRDAVGIAFEVLEHGFRSGEGTLGAKSPGSFIRRALDNVFTVKASA